LLKLILWMVVPKNWDDQIVGSFENCTTVSPHLSEEGRDHTTTLRREMRVQEFLVRFVELPNGDYTSSLSNYVSLF